MPLKRHHLLLVWIVASTLNSYSQEYPFIHYTPKDGLINSRLRSVYQDSKGRLFFMTANGLSMYDGARFTNYGPEHGLPNPVVNDMLEIAPDSLLLATNTTKLNAWVRGKIKTISQGDFCPVINKFVRDSSGTIYVATDQGVYSLYGTHFEKIDVENAADRDTVISFDDIQDFGNYLLVKVNYEMTRSHGLYLLDKKNKKLFPFFNESFSSVMQIPRYNILVCSSVKLLRSFDLNAARAGIAREVELPSVYHALKKTTTPKLELDNNENLWCLNLNSLLRITPNGNVLVFDKTTGLDVNNINGIFIDHENVLWIQTDGSGLIKLANNNVEIATGLFSKSATGISALYADPASDTTWLFDSDEKCLYTSTPNGVTRYSVSPNIMAYHLMRDKDHLYLFDLGKIYLLKPDKKNKRAFVAQLYYQADKNSIANINRIIIDNDYLYAPGAEICVIKDGRRIYSIKIPYYTDQIAIDKKKMLWAAPRNGALVCYSINPTDPSNFLKFHHNYRSVLPALNPRSIVIDTSNRIWVGTRYDGLYCFEMDDTTLKRQQHFTVKDGLTDNFIYYLACDRNNNIWVGSQSGLDKVSMQNGQYTVEGITRNNNIFQLIQNISVTKNNQVWTLGNSGSILRVTNNPVSNVYHPQLQISKIKVTDSVYDIPPDGLRFTHLQNNITFEMAAPSFIDEQQIKFSYLLEGSDNKQWSAPSQQATLNFINLPHGTYKLRVKASFPVSYSPQEMTYTFIITPPWWDTWWSKILMGAALIAFIVLIIRFYYQRKLEKQKTLFEKQQAVEQERTRIAMEMHDDLGSGLTTIRYLAGGLSLQSIDSSKEKAEKIATSAKSLVDNMNDIIWTMKSDNNTLSEALAYIRKQAAEQLDIAGIEYHIDFPKDLPEIKLSNELKRNLLLISKEAIHNIVKHSAATNVTLSAKLETGRLHLRIMDNGKGINLTEISHFGNGMKSMRKRAEEIQALLEVLNDKGTTIVVKSKLE